MNGEKECAFYTSDNTHTCPWSFEGPPNTCCSSGWKDMFASDQKPVWLVLKATWLNTSKTDTDLKLMIVWLYRTEWTSSFLLAVNKHLSSASHTLILLLLQLPTVFKFLSWCLNLFPSFELFTTKGRVLCPISVSLPASVMSKQIDSCHQFSA